MFQPRGKMNLEYFRNLIKKILGIIALGLLWCNISLSDEKPGRFFEDQPDVTDNYQIHFIYMLTASDKDRELDINGKIEEYADNKKLIKDNLRKDSSN